MPSSKELSDSGIEPGFPVARILEWVAMSSSKELSDSGIEPGFPVSSASHADSLPPRHQGSPVSWYWWP